MDVEFAHSRKVGDVGLAVGTRLGPYEIGSLLGAGGMGEVYRARDTRLDRVVAVKILDSKLVSSSGLKARFEREARTISQLNHPNICALYDIGHERGIDYLVMEFVEGETLAERISRGSLPLLEIVRIGSEIATGLEAAHRCGIIHRDLKPANIVLCKSGAKLLDFGLAKPTALQSAAGAAGAAVTRDISRPLTSHGLIVGTLQYMSPEQLEGAEVDSRSDIFSFGSILYEMATGRPAFSGKSQVSIASAILEKEPEPVSNLRPASPASLNHVIRTCLAKNAEERYQSAADVALQLRWMAQPSSETTAAIGGKRRWRTAILASISIATAAAGWWVGSRSAGLHPQAMHVAVGLVPGTLAGDTLNTPVIVSPDGHWLLYLVVREGHTKLYVRAFSDANGAILEGTDNARGPFFSSDSQWIAFEAGGKLKKIPVTGGSTVDICRITATDDSLGFLGGSWAENGRIVFVPGYNSGLWEVPASGGTPKVLLSADIAKDRVAATHPQILPDGKSVLFTSVPGSAKNPDDEEIAILEAGASEPRILVRGGSNARYVPAGYLVFGHGGGISAAKFDLATKTVTESARPVGQSVQGYPDPLYSVSNNGTLVYVPSTKIANAKIYVFDRKGNRRPISDGSSDPQDLAISPDGMTVVARVTGPNDDLWTFDTTRGTALRLTFEPGDEIYPQWTPDGKRIAYGTRTGTIYWRLADGSGPREELSHGDFPRYPSSFSPDGKWLAIVEATRSSGRNIWILPLTGADRIPIAFQATTADEWSPKFSPDGRFIAYVSDESGTTEIYIRPFNAAGGRRRITSNGGQLPVWNHDGRELFFIRGTSLMSVGIDASGNANSSERQLFDANANGDVLYTRANVYDVMPDGQHFVVSLAPSASIPPYYEVIINWFEELKRAGRR